MKQLLMSSIFSLITGFCFVGGALLAVSLFDEEKREARTHVDEPEGFKFEEHERINYQGKLSVKGIIKNTSNNEWDAIQIYLKLYAGEAFITYCSKSFDYLAPKSERPFTVVCREVDGHNIPENINYKLEVTRATLKSNV